MNDVEDACRIEEIIKTAKSNYSNTVTFKKKTSIKCHELKELNLALKTKK